MIKNPVSKKSVMKVVAPFALFASLNVFAIVLTFGLLLSTFSNTSQKDLKYSIYSLKPPVLGATSSRVSSADSRAAAIDQFFESYDCPMEGLGQVFVEEADKNNIPFWIVPAISFQESNCGKKIPIVNGVESMNAWGWGVYGDNVKMFDSWEHGIKVVSSYMNDRFYSRGITEPCEIMRVYTPPSKGSWCAGVEFFRDLMVNYKTPVQE